MNDVFSIPFGLTGKASVLYAFILSTENIAGVYRPTSSDFEAYNVLNRVSYAIPVIEVGETGVYQFEMPTPLQIRGKQYVVLVFQRPSPGATPSPTDALVQTGSIEIKDLSPGTTTGVEIRVD